MQLSGSGLSFNTMPAFNIPLRFFLTAPWFGVIAAAIVMVDNPVVWANRWVPVWLAVTHMLTLGFMAMIMLGAIFQVLPVLTGQLIPGTKIIAPIVHVLLTFGTALLAFGFYFTSKICFVIGLLCLLLMFLIFIAAVILHLVKLKTQTNSVNTIRLAVIALFVTVVLGAMLVVGYVFPGAVPIMSWLTNIHASWGLFGWSILLIMGVSFQVIPMFHVAPSYPEKMTRYLGAILFASLCVSSLLMPVDYGFVSAWISGGIVIYYAVYSYRLLNKRKRKIPDVTVKFWKLAFISLIAAVLLITLDTLFLLVDDMHRFHGPLLFMVGALLIFGGVISVIIGMIQKIIPFLGYMHLQQACLTNMEAMSRLPNMKEIIPELNSTIQFHFHWMALGLLLCSTIWHPMGAFAAIAMMVDFAWLGITVFMATLVYRRAQEEVIFGVSTTDSIT